MLFVKMGPPLLCPSVGINFLGGKPQMHLYKERVCAFDVDIVFFFSFRLWKLLTNLLHFFLKFYK